MEDPPGTLLRALAGGGAVRMLACEVSGAAERTRRAHGLGVHAARLAAEGVVATVLLSAYVKGRERLTLQLDGSRPRVAFWGEVDGAGHVRARLTPPDLVPREDDRIEGMLLAMKSDGTREVYRGHTLVEDEPLEAALGRHLALSGQTAVLLRVSVEQDPSGEITLAGGAMLERLPEDPAHPSLDEAGFEARYGVLREVPAALLLAGLPSDRLLDEHLHVLERRPVVWQCRCSQEKVEATLGGLGETALREMIEEDHGAEVTCHFCNTVYQVSEARLRALRELSR